jgi:hypothetical protein
VIPLEFGDCTEAGEIFSDGFEDGSTNAWN